MATRRIMVGVDGSANSHRALSWAATLAGALDAELIAVHAVGLLEHLPVCDESQVPADRPGQVVGAVEAQWCGLEAMEGLRSRRIVEDGPPAMVLLRLARREDVDLIVVGRRGIAGFDEMLLGSTSAHLAQHSPVPVTIVPGQGQAGAPQDRG